MINLSLQALANLLNCSAPTLNSEFMGISTDTRTLKPNNLFVAIKGEQFDGHHFLSEAINKGASAALVSQLSDLNLPQLQVNDTLDAFGKMAHAWRQRFSLPIIGVTGSNGKTTLKNMIASILQAEANEQAVLATQGNLNNNIGVPIMLCRLNASHRYAVLEMGMNHFGEIAYLTRLIQPQVAIINNAAEAHLEGLKNVAGVAKAKGEIFLGLSSNGTAILNRDDHYFNYWHGLVSQFNVLTFGLTNTADISAVINENKITLQTPSGHIEVKLPLIGIHNVMNALAATAATLAVGINLETIKQGLEKVSCAPGRMHQYTLSSGTRIIDDTYNANPFSLQAAVNTLATFSGTKIVVLGDMKELGREAKEMHFEAGNKIRKLGINHLFTLGEMTAETTKAFGQNALHFKEKAELIDTLKKYLAADTTILIKGSRSMKMEKIVEALVPSNEVKLKDEYYK